MKAVLPRLIRIVFWDYSFCVSKENWASWQSAGLKSLCMTLNLMTCEVVLIDSSQTYYGLQLRWHTCVD